MNFYDLLKAQAQIFGEKTFLQVDSRTFSYKNFFYAVESSEHCKNFFERGEQLRQADTSRRDNCSAAFKAANFFYVGKFFSQAVNFFAAQKNNPSDVFSVATSGSTSAPKILQRTFDSWNDFFPTQNQIFSVDATSRLFMHGDLNFTGNLNTFLAVLSAGGSIVTTDKFAPKTWLELIKTATNIYLVPTKLTLLAKGAPLDNIRAIFMGSQVLTEAQSLALMKKFPAAEIFLYYGASELSFVTYKKISAENAAEIQNLGKNFDKVKIFIRNGLIFVDTPYRALGIENPATVGDAGFINAHGDLIFLGRGEDFINRGGVKIFASAVEQKLLTIDGVEAVAVIKIGDKTRGENFAAYIVGNIDKKIIRQALTPAESPREIIFVPSLPLNKSGKVDKKILWEEFLCR